MSRPFDEGAANADENEPTDVPGCPAVSPGVSKK